MRRLLLIIALLAASASAQVGVYTPPATTGNTCAGGASGKPGFQAYCDKNRTACTPGAQGCAYYINGIPNAAGADPYSGTPAIAWNATKPGAYYHTGSPSYTSFTIGAEQRGWNVT